MKNSAAGFYKYLGLLDEFKFDFSLQRIKSLLKAQGNPQNFFNVVHVAGSNGKGSVAAYLSGVFAAHGIRAGLYTSPHLKDVRERIMVAGKKVPEDIFVKEGLALKAAAEKKKIKLTYFEFLTALAMIIFKKMKVKMAVIEAGLGGRYDATNLDYTKKMLSVITSVSQEHTKFLGKTTDLILKEKSRIIKKGPAVCNVRQEKLIRDLKHEFGDRVIFPQDTYSFRSVSHFRDNLVVTLKKAGEDKPFRVISSMVEFLQAENIMTVLACVDVLSDKLRLFREKAVDAMGKTSLEGRLSKKDGYYVSVAHNPGAIFGMLATLRAMYPGKKIVYVFSALKDKDLKTIFKYVNDYGPIEVMLTLIKNKRAISIERMEKVCLKYKVKTHKEPDNMKALAKAIKLKGTDGIVVAGGSFFLAERYA